MSVGICGTGETNWLWDKINLSAFGVQSTSLSMFNEWKKCHQEKQVPRSVATTSRRKWDPPPPGWVKINVDAATFMETKSVGIGSIIRDEQGAFVRVRNQKIDCQLHPREAEAVGLKEALSWTENLGFKNCIFETDAKLVVDAIKENTGCAYFHTIIEDCVDLLKHFDNVLVQFVHRSANVVARTLARATHSMSGIQEWSIVALNFISDVIVLDLN